MKKTGNVIVKARPKERSDRLIKRFIKKVKKEKIIELFRDRQRYEKPSVKRKLKRKRAQRARVREEIKLKKRRERNKRNYN